MLYRFCYNNAESNGGSQIVDWSYVKVNGDGQRPELKVGSYVGCADVIDLSDPRFTTPQSRQMYLGAVFGHE